jgi:hypothetical protein
MKHFDFLRAINVAVAAALNSAAAISTATIYI